MKSAPSVARGVDRQAGERPRRSTAGQRRRGWRSSIMLERSSRREHARSASSGCASARRRPRRRTARAPARRRRGGRGGSGRSCPGTAPSVMCAATLLREPVIAGRPRSRSTRSSKVIQRACRSGGRGVRTSQRVPTPRVVGDLTARLGDHVRRRGARPSRSAQCVERVRRVDEREVDVAHAGTQPATSVRRRRVARSASPRARCWSASATSASRSRSTNVHGSAPATAPRCPSPPSRRTGRRPRVLDARPSRLPSELNTASRTLSVVGRVVTPAAPIEPAPTRARPPRLALAAGLTAIERIRQH